MYSTQLSKAATCVRRGGTVAYPTESVYGLGCDPNNPDAVKKLLELKQRGAEHGLILIAHDFEFLAPYCQPLDVATRKRINRTWPGPYTWVLRATARATAWLTGGRDSIAVRVTAHPLAAALCRACGHALVSTSANPHGCLPARTVAQARAFFQDGGIDYILPGSVGGRARPTPIFFAADGHVIRAA